MKQVIVFGLLILLVGVLGESRFNVDEGDCCTNGMMAFLCPRCWENCPQRPDGIKNMEKYLLSRVFGQDEAIRKITDAFSSRQAGLNKPLVLHFAGDNGVGKTLTALAISEALFSVKNKLTNYRKGTIYLQGHDYSINIGTSELSKEGFYNDLVSQVKKQVVECPFSLIIIDEFELLGEKTMYDLLKLIEDPIMSKTVFILISDLGKEGVTSDMHDPSGFIENLILQEMEFKWGNTKRSKNSPALFKVVNQIQTIIPFLPMMLDTEGSGEAIDEQVKFLLGQIIEKSPRVCEDNDITIDKIIFVTKDSNEGIQNLRNYLLYKLKTTPGYSKRNYRGIEQIFHLKVVNSLTQVIRRELILRPDFKGKHCTVSLSFSNNATILNVGVKTV